MKKRKHYRPKYVARNPMVTFFGGMSGQHAEELTELNAKNAAALAKIVTGSGDKDAWDRIVGAVNMANVMSEQGIGPEYRDDILAARDAMLEVGKRFMRTKRFVLTGDELRTMNEFMLIHEAQLSASRAIDLDRAADEVIRRVQNRINSTSVQREMAAERAA